MTTGWVIGYAIGLVVVIVLVVLVVSILRLAHSIGQEATMIDDSLLESVDNTAALTKLTTTIEHAEIIVAGLHRGRTRLGG
ncbi:MAG TPA: hypothetical protein VGL80_31340 [Pseudonocardiaceae bacterium]|jgi:uncharacterized membrane protein (Fun14 family)